MTVFLSQIAALTLLLLAISNVRAATPASIEVLRPNRTYDSGTFCELNRVDFRNFTYFTGEWMGASDEASPADPVRVSHGKYGSHEMGSFEELFVDTVAHPNPGQAVVSLWHSYAGGSSSQELVVMVFQCVDGRLTNTQLIHGDGHGNGTGVILSDGGKKMVMNSVYDYTNGHCCPRYLETVAFRLAKRGYILVSTHKKENRYPR